MNRTVRPTSLPTLLNVPSSESSGGVDCGTRRQHDDERFTVLDKKSECDHIAPLVMQSNQGGPQYNIPEWKCDDNEQCRPRRYEGLSRC